MPSITFRTLKLKLIELLIRPYRVTCLSENEMAKRFTDTRSALLLLPFTSLGNVVLAMRALPEMRTLLPNATIDLVIYEGFASLVRGADVGRVIPFGTKHLFSVGQYFQILTEVRRAEYDVIVDCSFGSKTAASFALLSKAQTRIAVADKPLQDCFHICLPKHPDLLPIRDRWSYFMQAIGQVDSGQLARIDLCPDEIDWAREWYSRNGLANAGTKVVMIAPGGRASANRDWPLDHFIEVSHSLRDRGYAVVFMLGPDEEIFRGELERRGPEGSIVVERNSMRLDAALMSMSSLYLGCDCGATHLAKAVGTQVLVIQRHDDPFVWGPSPLEGRCFIDPGAIPKRSRDELVEVAVEMLAIPGDAQESVAL